MPAYTPTTWINGSTAVNQTNMNHIETQLTAVQYGVNILATPYVLLAAATLTAGTVNTYTVTGGGTGIPAGAIAVLLQCSFSSASTGPWIQFAPHSGDLAKYMTLGNITTSGSGGTINGVGIQPIDTSGKMDVRANSANCTVTVNIYGYVY